MTVKKEGKNEKTVKNNGPVSEKKILPSIEPNDTNFLTEEYAYARKYVGQAIKNREDFISARIITLKNTLEHITLDVFKPEETIGIIPNGSTKPLIAMLNDTKKIMEDIHYTIREEAITLCKDNIEFSNVVYLDKNGAIIRTDQLTNTKQFRKEQKKRVRKPKLVPNPDGQMTPVHYIKHALSKKVRNSSQTGIKTNIDKEVEKLPNLVSKTKKLNSEFNSVGYMVVLNSTASMLNKPELVKSLAEKIISEDGIFNEYLDTRVFAKLEYSLDIYSKMFRLEADNNARKAGIKEKEELLEGYSGILDGLKNILRKSREKN